MWLAINGLTELFLGVLWLAVHMTYVWVGIGNIPWPAQLSEVAWFLGEPPLENWLWQKTGGGMDSEANASESFTNYARISWGLTL